MHGELNNCFARKLDAGSGVEFFAFDRQCSTGNESVEQATLHDCYMTKLSRLDSLISGIAPDRLLSRDICPVEG